MLAEVFDSDLRSILIITRPFSPFKGLHTINFKKRAQGSVAYPELMHQLIKRSMSSVHRLAILSQKRFSSVWVVFLRAITLHLSHLTAPVLLTKSSSLSAAYLRKTYSDFNLHLPWIDLIRCSYPYFGSQQKSLLKRL